MCSGSPEEGRFLLCVSYNKERKEVTDTVKRLGVALRLVSFFLHKKSLELGLLETIVYRPKIKDKG